MKRFLFLLFLLFPGLAHAAISLVQSPILYNGSVNFETPISVVIGTGGSGSNVTAGSGIVVLVSLSGDRTSDFTGQALTNETISKISCVYMDVYTHDTLCGYYVKSVGTSEAKTLSWSVIGSSTAYVIHVFEVTGHDATTFYDQSTTNQSITPTCTATLSSVPANAAVFAFMSHTVNGFAAGSGYTSTGSRTASQYEDGEYKLDVAAGGTVTANVTTCGYEYGEYLASFKVGGAPPAATRRKAIIVQ